MFATAEDVTPVPALRSAEDADGTEEPEPAPAKELSKKSVRWSESDSVRQFHIDEVLSANTSCAPTGQGDGGDTPLKLTFTHTPVAKKRAKMADSVVKCGGERHVISSPSEIFDKFYGNASDDAEPRSILKVKTWTAPLGVNDEPQPSASPETGNKVQFLSDGDGGGGGGHAAIQHQVVERPTVASAEELAQVNTHRPVSRFKASRSKRPL